MEEETRFQNEISLKNEEKHHDDKRAIRAHLSAFIVALMSLLKPFIFIQLKKIISRLVRCVRISFCGCDGGKLKLRKF